MGMLLNASLRSIRLRAAHPLGTVGKAPGQATTTADAELRHLTWIPRH
jgi:hypothetical protein